jgi:hypothetical protein
MREHDESTARRYALAEETARLGWSGDRGDRRRLWPL